MQMDPLLAGLQHLFEGMLSSSEGSFELAQNPLKHHLESDDPPEQMYQGLTQKLVKENS